MYSVTLTKVKNCCFIYPWCRVQPCCFDVTRCQKMSISSHLLLLLREKCEDGIFGAFSSGSSYQHPRQKLQDVFACACVSYKVAFRSKTIQPKQESVLQTKTQELQASNFSRFTEESRRIIAATYIYLCLLTSFFSSSCY